MGVGGCAGGGGQLCEAGGDGLGLGGASGEGRVGNRNRATRLTSPTPPQPPFISPPSPRAHTHTESALPPALRGLNLSDLDPAERRAKLQVRTHGGYILTFMIFKKGGRGSGPGVLAGA